jgi:hypothetical protein
MSMHMVHPGLTALRTNSKKRKPGAKQLRAAAEHEAWLRSQNLHPDQLATRVREKPKKLKNYLNVDKTGPQCGNGFAPGGAKKSVFDSQWQRTYEDDPNLAEREAAALRKAEAIKSNLMPLYNKGPIQLQTNLANLKDGNGRGRT